MAHGEYVYPVSDENTFWRAGSDDPISLGHLLSDIQDHFGVDSTLDQFDIESYRWTLEDPCSCCRDSGVYANYYKITKRGVPCVDTKSITINDLHRYGVL